MIIVIADDITGAAEIAGLGHDYGLSTVLLTQIPNSLPSCQLLVLATDTRSLPEEKALAETQSLCQQLRPILHTANERIILFKKVDAWVRGHVVGELQAVLDNTAYQQAFYMPANPSHGQIIRGGCYYVDGEPLDQTQYALISDFPAVTASICLRLQITPQSRIRVPDAVTPEDVRQIVMQAMQGPNLTLLAGAADLFSALLEYQGYAPLPEHVFGGLSREGSTLIVCGSKQSTDLSSRPFVRRRELPLHSMPLDVYEGTQGAAYWLANIQVRHFSRAAIQPARNGLILNIPYASGDSVEAALRRRTEMADVVFALVERMCPTELIVEGGATAFAIMQRFGWTQFEITERVSPGVVRMRSEAMGNMHFTFKPGSYPWGDALFDWDNTI